MRLKNFAAVTNEGPYLQVNEDGYDFDFENDIFMVLDGFGGSGTGDVAVTRLKQEIKTYYTQISDDPNATMPLYYNPRNILEGNAVLNAMIHAHDNLLKKNAELPIGKRAGASALVAVRAESVLVLVGVGSCRAYHFRNGTLTRIISEDTLQFMAKDKFGPNFRSSPMSAFGLYPDLGFQVREVRISKGDKVLLLTDGAFSRIEEEELSYSLSKQAIDSQERINNLLNLSNTRGNLDNQTAMILEF